MQQSMMVATSLKTKILCCLHLISLSVSYVSLYQISISILKPGTGNNIYSVDVEQERYYILTNHFRPASFLWLIITLITLLFPFSLLPPTRSVSEINQLRVFVHNSCPFFFWMPRGRDVILSNCPLKAYAVKTTTSAEQIGQSVTKQEPKETI